MPPIVTQRDWSRRETSVPCPLCTDGTRIARDASAWRVHMESTHSADSGTWTNVKTLADADGPLDGRVTVHLAHRCWGCGSTFSSRDSLISHLSAVHSVS